MLIRPTKTTVLIETRYVYWYRPNSRPHWCELSDYYKKADYDYAFMRIIDDNPLRNASQAVYAEFTFNSDGGFHSFNQLTLIETAKLERIPSPLPTMHPHLEVGPSPSFNMLQEKRYKAWRRIGLFHKPEHKETHSNV